MSSQQFLSKHIKQQFTMNMVGNFVKPVNVEAYRKMIVYRCNNMGMKELDISLGTWAKANVDKLSYEDCEQFEKEVLDHETPDLFYLILKNDIQQELDEYKSKKYIQELRNFAFSGLNL